MQTKDSHTLDELLSMSPGEFANAYAAYKDIDPSFVRVVDDDAIGQYVSIRGELSTMGNVVEQVARWMATDSAPMTVEEYRDLDPRPLSGGDK